MDMKKFLDENPMINQAQLAKSLWPKNDAANIKLANKIANRAGQRITPKDEALIKHVLGNLSKQLKKFIESDV